MAQLVGGVFRADGVDEQSRAEFEAIGDAGAWANLQMPVEAGFVVTGLGLVRQGMEEIIVLHPTQDRIQTRHGTPHHAREVGQVGIVDAQIIALVL